MSVISQAFAPAWAASFPLCARGGHWGCVSAAGSCCAAGARRPFGLPAYNRQWQSSPRRHGSFLPHRPGSPVCFEELGGCFGEALQATCGESLVQPSSCCISTGLPSPLARPRAGSAWHQALVLCPEGGFEAKSAFLWITACCKLAQTTVLIGQSIPGTPAGGTVPQGLQVCPQTRWDLASHFRDVCLRRRDWGKEGGASNVPSWWGGLEKYLRLF